MRKSFYAILLAVAFLGSACESWLDVQPKTEIKSDDLFETEEGFKDALIGAYTLMKAESLYGRELTFGFLDVVTGVYNYYNNPTYQEVGQWKYTTSSSVRSQIDAMWTGMYNMIANLNNLLDNIDAQQSVFTGDNYNIIKGEALGLRAYVHFDLLRLFASAVDLDAEAIPYVRTLQIEVPQVYTGRKILSMCNEDINAALACLENDPIRTGELAEDPDGDGFLNDRQRRMNYYAVKALQARVAMWGGDLETAKTAAGEVLEVADEIFPWVSTEAVSATNESDRDFSFSSEQIFALDVRDLRDLANTWFLSTGDNQLYFQSYTMQQWYEIGRGNNVGSFDYRVNYVLEYSSTLYGYVTRKYYQPENYNSDYARRIPLIRRSEMEYIMAECLMNEDADGALEYLNEVRRHRGITADLTDASTLRDEITKEYAKEFLSEGQLFYYCKRNALATFPYGYQTVSEDVYVLPKPDNELEFGDYYTVDE